MKDKDVTVSKIIPGFIFVNYWKEDLRLEGGT